MSDGINRRSLLRTIGTSSIGVAATGTVSADDTDKILDVEVTDLTGLSRWAIERQARRDEATQRLLDEAAELGWQPNWDAATAKRKTVDTESLNGSFDTLVLPLQSDDGETVRLVWNGNDSLGIDEISTGFLEHVTTGPVLASAAIRTKERKSGATKVTSGHSESKSPTGAESLTQVDDPSDLHTVVYRSTEDGIVTEEDVHEDIRRSHLEKRSLDRSSGAEAHVSDGDYCSIDVDVVYAGTGWGPTCIGVDCLLAVSGINAGAIYTCVTTPEPFVCLAGIGLSVWTIGDCVTCEVEHTVVDMDPEWLTENIHEHDPPLYPHPCDRFSSANEVHLPLTRCEVENAETREDFNFPQC